MRARLTIAALAGGVLTGAVAAGTAAMAEPPEVAADIAPVHSLVATVMEGAGEPTLLIAPSRSPHHGALRPSTARALASAEIVFRVTPGLAPWLAEATATLAPEAAVVDLIAVPGAMRLHRRDDAMMAAHMDGGHGHGGGHGGDHEDTGAATADPHAWLAPANARVWLSTIAARLAEADPENAALYRDNAAAARDALARLDARLDARLAPVAGVPFAVMHDAFHYLEHGYGLRAVGATTPSEGVEAGPARVAAMRERLEAAGATCLFVEPQGDRALAETVAEGTGTRVVMLDPIGADETPGPGLYEAVLSAMAEAMAGCLSEGASERG